MTVDLLFVCGTLIIFASIFGWTVQRLQSIQAQGMLAAFQATAPPPPERERTVRPMVRERGNGDPRVFANAE